IAAILRAPENSIGAAKAAERVRDHVARYEWNVGADDDKRTPAAAVKNALHAVCEAASALANALAFPSRNRHPGRRIGAYPGSFGMMSRVSTFGDPAFSPSGRSGMTIG